MRLYLYLIDEEPHVGTDLHRIQGILEDRLLERREVSDVWWNDKNPFTPRVYLYGGSHSDWLAAEAADEDAEISWEEQDQLIWERTVPPTETPSKTLDPLGISMSLKMVTPLSSFEMGRVIPMTVWEGSLHRPDLIRSFAVEAAVALGAVLTPKEKS